MSFAIILNQIEIVGVYIQSYVFIMPIWILGLFSAPETIDYNYKKIIFVAGVASLLLVVLLGTGLIELWALSMLWFDLAFSYCVVFGVLFNWVRWHCFEELFQKRLTEEKYFDASK